MSETHDVMNPATEQFVTTVDLLDQAAADEAIARSRRAFTAWRAVSPGDRARLLRRFADAVDADAENLARLEVTNSGHTITNARWEAGSVRDVIAYYSGAPERLIGQQIPVPDGIDVTFHEPLGVVGAIVPWNFPMPIASWAFAPALAAGNTVVLKPAELTPLTSLRLARLALEAGLPEDVFQVLPGKGSVVGARFVEHPDVAKIVFTGSTEVGRQIMAGCSARLKPVTLELGGKSANIVFADADIQSAAQTAPYAVFDNAGQDCCARSRILVQREAYDAFMEVFETAVKGVLVSDPADESAQMGPLISAAQRETVRSYVREEQVAFRGTAPEGVGFWYPPTVLTPDDPQDRVLHEEIFGPVVAVVRFEDEEDAIRIANDSQFGLSGSIWTRDLGRAIRVSRGVESGNLSVNSHSSVRYWTPFGGFKSSGLGRELGPDAPFAFTETKNVFISTKE
ncbi:MAG: aldehyde dehydrogenase family protein [Actinomycetota bacterium]|nr:aldehyde dehydrogenase family protein [Actinomycetota bacterium]